MIIEELEKFTVYDSEAETVLENLEALAEYTNKIPYGDHKGSWQGLDRPTLSEEGMRATVENLADVRVKNLEDNIPYTEYERDLTVGYGEKYYHYDGFSNHSKKTFGRYEDATVMSIIANTDNPAPQILGSDTLGLATYTNRDSASLYVENNGGKPVLQISNGVTYTFDSAILPSDTDMTKIKAGMIVDVGKTVNTDWFVGIIKEIDGYTLKMEDGFYLVRNDGGTPIKSIPTDGQVIKIQMTNKVWSINSNLFINEGCPAGCNIEVGVLSNHTDVNDVGGIDVVNLRKPTHYGVKVRAGETPFNEGFVSQGNGRHFVGISSNNTVPLLQGRNGANSFEIKMDGTLSQQRYSVQTLTASSEISNNCGVVFLLGDNINATLPLAANSQGRIIEVVSRGTNNLLTCKTGDGILTPDEEKQQIYISNGAKNMNASRYVSDGIAKWFKIS